MAPKLDAVTPSPPFERTAKLEITKETSENALRGLCFMPSVSPTAVSRNVAAGIARGLRLCIAAAV